MAAAFIQPLLNKIVITPEINQANMFANQKVTTIDFLQRRACEYAVLTALKAFANQVAKGFQPGLSIGIIQGNTVFHLFDIGRRVKIIRVVILPTKLSSKLLADRGFARTGHTHQDNDHLLSLWSGGQTFALPGANLELISAKRPIRTPAVE